MSRFSLFTLLAAIVFMSVACASLAGCTPPNKTVIGGGGASSGDFSISGANLVVQEPQPAVAFNLVDPPSEDRQFAYFMILKYPVASNPNSQEYSGNVTNDGTTGRSAGTFSINGKELSVEYRATVQASGFANESLEINGTEQPLQKGRVFLVDLAADPISVVQHNLKLPSNVTEVSSTSDAEALAKRTLAELEMGSSAVSDFAGSMQ